jgi:cytochrome P450
MGHSMLRKDDPQHAVEREVWQPVLKPRAIKAQWQQVFEANAAKYLEEFRAIGTGADLIKGFAAPYAAENLRIICGFENATQEDLQRWSQTMIDGTGNYANDPEIWAKSKRSYDEVDIALDEMLAHYKNNPNGSLISGLANSTGYQMPIESMRANLKMTIGGGLNEPRDVLGVTAWALMERPEQLADVMADQTLWPAAFEESIRWISPIGFYPRQTTRDVELGGVMIPKGAKVGVSLLSANRDETRFPESSVFNIHREKIPHLAFGTGSHYCAGAWVAKASVAGVGLPTLFNNLKNLRLDPENPAQIGGWVFRGMLNLPVLWD